jgi:hypothetical protein
MKFILRSVGRLTLVIMALIVVGAGLHRSSSILAKVPQSDGACCSIVSVNAINGVVTATVNATGQQFQFTLTNTAQARALRAGQAVYANFTTKQVSLDGQHIAGQIVNAGVAPGVKGVGSAPAQQALGAATNAEGPCCNIAAIDTNTGIVTAKVSATGQQFQFTMNNPVQLQSLHVGQAVYANFTSKQVSLDGKTPAGQISSMGPAVQGQTSQGMSSTASAASSSNKGKTRPTTMPTVNTGDASQMKANEGNGSTAAAIRGIAPPHPTQAPVQAVAAAPMLSTGGTGMAPCGADQIPNLVGPLPPSPGALSPLAAVNELQRIVWTNFGLQTSCDLSSQFHEFDNKNVIPSPFDSGKNDAGIHWSAEAKATDVRTNIDLAAAPGLGYACLTQQDCPAGAAPGFQVQVPVGNPWSIAAHAVFEAKVHVWEEVGGSAGHLAHQVTGGGNPQTDIVAPCGLAEPLDVSLSNIRLSERTDLDARDPSRPLIRDATASAELTLNLAGFISTAGPQQVHLAASLTADSSGSRSQTLFPIKPAQIVFTSPNPIPIAIQPINSCGLHIPGVAANLSVGLSWDSDEQTVNVKLSAGELEIVLAQVGQTKIPIRVPLEKTFSFALPHGLLHTLAQGLPPNWGENPPAQFWTQAADPSTDFAGAANQLESAIVPHMPFGAILSINHSHATPLTIGVNRGNTANDKLFAYDCPLWPAESPSGPTLPVARRSHARECYRVEADSSIWTGHYLAAEAFRYAATHSQDALARIQQVLGGIQKLFWVTEDAAVAKGHIVAVRDTPGLFSRTAIPSNSEFPMGEAPDGTIPSYRKCYYERPEGGWDVQIGSTNTHYAKFADIPPTILAQPGTPVVVGRPGVSVRPVGVVWYGLGCGEGADNALSRDQYVGMFMGLTYAHALVSDPSVQQITRDLITSALVFLIRNNWDVRLAPYRRIPLDSNFLRAWDYQLGFLRIGASVNPGAIMPNGVSLAQLYQIYAPGTKLSWVPSWATALGAVSGGYFGFNLNQAVIGPTLFLESDPNLRQNYFLWYNIIRRATQHHKNAYFNLVSVLVGATTPAEKPSPSNPTLSVQEEAKGILQEWLRRRDAINAGDGLPFDFVGDPSYQARLFTSEGVARYTNLRGNDVYVARYAMPLYARVGDGLDFAWQKGPFDMAVGPNPGPCFADLPHVLVSAGGTASSATSEKIYVCGSDKTNLEAPGVDYLLPYWMAVYLGVLPPPPNTVVAGNGSGARK